MNPLFTALDGMSRLCFTKLFLDRKLALSKIDSKGLRALKFFLLALGSERMFGVLWNYTELRK